MASKRKSSNENHQSKRSRSLGAGSNDTSESNSRSDEESNEDSSEQSIGGREIRRRAKDAEIGIIESVELRNFMCHARLKFKFGSNVNFIIGKNGSGKSAIMTAIVVGLGGSASTTNRGTSIRDFIMNGKQVGKVSIELKNVGNDAYKPNEYGCRIIIERTFQLNGCSIYKLRNVSGKVVSSKKEELLNILDQFNIQVDNPICILNQDASRNFLNSKNPKNKYKLFLKATQLEQMSQDYEHARHQQETATKIINQKALGLSALEKEVEEWKRKHEFHQNIDKLREEKNRLTREIGWAEFSVIEKELEDGEKKLENLNNRSPKFLEKVEESQNKLLEAQEKQKAVEQLIEETNAELKANQMLHTQSKSEVEFKRQQYKNVCLEMRKLMGAIKHLSEEEHSLKSHIEKLRQVDSSEQAVEKQQRLNRIAMLEESRLDLEARYRTMEPHCDQLKHAVSRSKEQLCSLRQEQNRHRARYETKQQSLQNLEGSRTNHLRRFGAWVPELLNRLENAYKQGRFRQKPRGPLGAHIKLREAKWNVAIEACLKSNLHAFYCDNHEDARTLERMFAEVIHKGPKPSVIVSEFADEMYDVSAGRVKSTAYYSILDMLDIDDYLVVNCLIDQRQIETILLIGENSEARHVMQKAVPFNCSEAYTACGDQIYPAPNFRYYSSRDSRATLLQENVEAVITTLRNECMEIQQEITAVQERLDSVTNDFNTNNNEISTLEKQISQIQQQMQKTRQEINKLQNVEDPEPVAVSSLEEDLEATSVKLDSCKADLKKCEESKQELKSAVALATESYEEIENKLQTLITDNVEPLKESLASAANEVSDAASGHEHYKRKQRQHEEAVTNQKDQCDAKRLQVEEWRNKCIEELGERVVSPYPLEKIRRMFVMINAKLETEEQILGDPVEIGQTYREMMSKYVQIKEDIDNMKEFLQKLELNMDMREDLYAEIRAYLTIRIRAVFITMLNQRNYKGDIQFNHQKETLEIVVQPAQNVTEQNNTKDVRGLSGGERSFATVSFVLALWEAMESPFRMMDEFDVFMDMINRRLSMELMLDVAASKANNQFIFLTPLDMTKLQASNTIRIFKMNDPDRNQGVLPFVSNGNGTQNNADDDDDRDE